jgi:hypothetical protein
MRVCQFRHFGTHHEGSLTASTRRHESKSFKHGGCCQSQHALTYTQNGRSTANRCRESERPYMSEQKPVVNQSAAEEIPENLAIEIRKLAHELSNALEVIVQTTYLLGTVELKEPGSEWLRMLDSGVRRALDINLSLRSYIKQHSPK